MTDNFSTVNQLLRADHGRTTAVITLVALLGLGSWGAWAWFARVTRYEISDSARLEIDSALYPIQTNVSGKLKANHLQLGQMVSAGDVLLEFDSESEQLALNEERTHFASLRPQLDALRGELEAENGGRTEEQAVLQATRPGAQAQLEQAMAEAALANEEWKRAERMRAEKLISEAEAAKAKTAAESKRAAVDNLRAAASKLQPELALRQRDRDIATQETRLDVAKLEAAMATSAAAIKKLEYEIERRKVRAPASGRLAECASLRTGAHVGEGERVGVILPSGKLQVIAQFQPSAALGRVHAGQNAVLRLQGFPWAQYGTIPVRVSRVADEIRDGKVRVELAVNPSVPSRIPVQHGLPGSVEVEIERISPATLILRSAGELAGAH